MNDNDVHQVTLLLKLVIWLVTKADNKGLTHGEKHHFHMVIINIVDQCLSELGDHTMPFERSVDDVPNDIPF